MWKEGKTQQQCEMKKSFTPSFLWKFTYLPAHLVDYSLTYLLAFTDHYGYAFPQEAVATTNKYDKPTTRKQTDKHKQQFILSYMQVASAML